MIERIRSARADMEVMAGELDVAGCSGRDALDLLAELGALRRLVDGMLTRATKRVDETGAYTYDGDRSTAETYARVVGTDRGEARRVIEVAAHLRSLPGTDAALRAGRISTRAAEQIVAGAAGDPAIEGELLAAADRGLVPLRDAVIAARAAREDQAARSARQHAARSFRAWTRPDGMVEGHFTVTPEVGGAIRARIDELARRRFRQARPLGAHESQDAYAADALAEAILDGGGAGSARYTTHVVVDHEALLRGSTVAGERCEIPGVGPVSVEWVRELLGAAFVTAIVAKGRDITTVAHFGRHIPAELRTAMIVSGRECCVAGCTGRDYLEIDHCEIDHGEGGPTARWNLAWMCSVHHLRKTNGWRLGPPDPATGKRRLEPPEREREAA